MGKHDEIRTALAKFCGQYGPAPTVLATVKSVDANEKTCVLFDDNEEIEIPEVRLSPVIDATDGLTLFPKLNTWALAVRIENDEEWMLIAAGEYDKWRLHIGTSTIEQDATGLLVQKGADTLKQALTLIVESVQMIAVVYGNNPDYVKLQQAMTKINNLLR